MPDSAESFSLPLQPREVSFWRMRFEVSNLVNSPAAPVEIPWRDSDGESYADLREDAAAITGIVAARENPPIAALLLALNGHASIFSTVRAKTWIDSNASPAGGKAESIFNSRVDLVFSDSKLNTQERQEDAVRRLIELWMKEPASESFSARLEILPCRIREASNAAALRITLSARGATPEQARMRWGLGVTKVQQSLLFVSRTLRQTLGIGA